MTVIAEASRTVSDTDRRTPPAIHELLLRIESEYREMPGLSLTASQAARLWGLNGNTCALALKTLIERRVLRKTTIGTYVRPSSG